MPKQKNQSVIYNTLWYQYVIDAAVGSYLRVKE